MSFIQPNVSREDYLYALKNFRIAHEKVEQQRAQLEEQEKQVATLRQRIALLESSGRPHDAAPTGSVDDFSIKNAASRLEKLINRWAADVIRNPPAPLESIRDAVLADLSLSESSSSTPSAFTGFTPYATPLFVQNILRHLLSHLIAETLINCFTVTDSAETNLHLTQLHEQLFARNPTVACVWRRHTFSAAVESHAPEFTLNIIQQSMPNVADLFSQDGGRTMQAWFSILDSAYAFSRMLHGSQSDSGGTTDTFYRAFVPEVGDSLRARQVELVKRCLRTERNEQDRVGATIFLGLMKIRQGPNEPDGQPGGPLSTVVRRAQVMCDCALHNTGGFRVDDVPGP